MAVVSKRAPQHSVCVFNSHFRRVAAQVKFANLGLQEIHDRDTILVAFVIHQSLVQFIGPEQIWTA